MNFDQNELSKAIGKALSLGALVAMGVAWPAFAQDQATTPPSQTNASPAAAQNLKAVVVTGSRIRRVDIETANPVITVTPELIKQTGSVTLGDILQTIPSITGSSRNPNSNNGGSGGQTLVGLRGLGPQRTLVLVDGQRVISSDLNQIPAAMVDRIEVLTTGSSSVYGSDAIGGVINIILKSNYEGAQIELDSGISSRSDGQTRGASAIFGHTSDKGSIMAGVGYNKTDEIPNANRAVSAHAISITGSTNTPPHTFLGGSNWAPRGTISLPKSLRSQFGCGTVSLNPSASGGMGAPTTLADYHCTDATKDRFNFEAYRPLTTPQERTYAFFKGNYNVTDNIQASLTYLHNKTNSGFGLGPPIGGTPGGFIVSKDSIYNPFGVDWTPTNGNVYRSAMVPLGSRWSEQDTTNDQAIFDLKGSFSVMSMDWTWDAGYNFGRIGLATRNSGLPNLSALNPGLGPSMYLNGVPTCLLVAGNPGTAIAGCTPWDPFNLYNPASLQILPGPGLGLPANNTSISIERVKHIDLSGGLIDLPAGTVQLAAGLDWRSEYQNNRVDPVLLVDSVGSCAYSSMCSSPLKGGFSVKEAYGELFVPVLKDVPFVHSLNLDLGDRYSKFSDFGSTSNWKIGVEYRPIADLLFRGNVAQVFRAPTISDIFRAPSFGGSTFPTDPCDHITAANAACAGVPLDGTFINSTVAQHAQTLVAGSGSAYAGFPISPEQGKSFDFGAVYSPSYLPGLSVSVDVWRIYLNDVITNVAAQTVLNACFNGLNSFCTLIHRYAADTASPGQILRVNVPTANLGRVNTSGTDLDARYRFPELPFGQFTLQVQGSYLKQYDLQTAPGLAVNQIIHEAGNINTDVGTSLLPRLRSATNLTWQLGSWSASWRIQTIGAFDLGSKKPSRHYSAIPGYKADNPQVLHFGTYVYNDVTVGYEFKPINTRIDVGIRNLMDKGLPLMYENNIGSSNGNTSSQNFDPMGRYYWARVTVNF